MKPMRKQPRRKPTKTRTQNKEREVAERKRSLFFAFFSTVDGLKGVPKLRGFWEEASFRAAKQRNKLVLTPELRRFLEGKGMSKKALRDTAKQAAELVIQDTIEWKTFSKMFAISGTDEAIVLRKMRALLAAMEEAKEAGII